MMDNNTYQAVVDRSILGTESILKRILTILLFDEGKWAVLGLILFIILWFMKRLLKKQEGREEEIWKSTSLEEI
jgi:hypothetical protein